MILLNYAGKGKASLEGNCRQWFPGFNQSFLKFPAICASNTGLFSMAAISWISTMNSIQ